MAKTDNLTDFLTDVANAIREKKGTTEPINPQDFSTEIASIESGEIVPTGVINRVTYLRRRHNGYIDTGVNGANNNLTIKIRYAFRTFPTGYWRLIYAYANEDTNTTRIILNKNTQILGSINSKASGGSITANRTSYTNIIYTDVIEPTSNTTFKLVCNGVSASRTRTTGETLDKTILIFSNTRDTVDVELYECKIYDNGVLIRNFIPDYRNGEYGLYDTVNKQFYGNVGEGAFTGEMIEFSNGDNEDNVFIDNIEDM